MSGTGPWVRVIVKLPLALEAVCAAMAKLRIAQCSTKHAHHAAVARSIRAVRAPQQPCALRVPVHASCLQG